MTDSMKKNYKFRSIPHSFWAHHMGCLHVRGELFMATGFMDKYSSDIPPCGDKCCICTGEWAKYFLPVDRDMVVTFLQSEEVTKQTLLLAKNNNLTNVLWKSSEEMRGNIFGRKGATKYNCDCLFLQLIASKLIKLDKRR